MGCIFYTMNAGLHGWTNTGKALAGIITLALNNDRRIGFAGTDTVRTTSS